MSSRDIRLGRNRRSCFCGGNTTLGSSGARLGRSKLLGYTLQNRRKPSLFERVQRVLDIEFEGGWSKEQIASALQLVKAGVSVSDVTALLGASPQMLSAWVHEYAELFEKLINSISEVGSSGNVGKPSCTRRRAYMSDCPGDEALEDELQACKIRHSVVEDVKATAAAMLKSGKILGNFGMAFGSPSARSTHSAPFRNSSEHAASVTKSTQAAMRMDGTTPPKAPKTNTGALVLVSARIAEGKRVKAQSSTSECAVALSGAVSGEIHELWWRSCRAGGGQIEGPIIQESNLEFRLDAILDAPINAIRMFYTSPMDALLIGDYLLQKS